MTPKTIIFVRHAHRNTDRGRERDNGISKKGCRQTERLLSYWISQEVSDAVFLSSPKRRCLETLEPLAQEMKKSLEIEPLLDEQREEPLESSVHFKDRVQQMMDKLAQRSEETVFVCSHSDWLDEALEKMLENPLHLKKGQWVEVAFNA